VRGDVGDDGGLPRRVRRMPWRSTQVPGRSHRTAAGRTSLHHLDLPAHPGAGVLDRAARSRVLGLRRLEAGKDVLGAQCRPQSQQLVIRIGERPAAADGDEARVPDLREDHAETHL
jgi:hypothetical protein